METKGWDTIPLPANYVQQVVIIWECTRCHCRLSSVLTGRIEPSETHRLVCYSCDKAYRITLPMVLIESFLPHHKVVPAPTSEPPPDAAQAQDHEAPPGPAEEHQPG